MRPGVRLGVDVGDVRIGVASCDPSGLVATPVETVARGRGDLDRLRALSEDLGAVEMVVGLPRSLSGGEGPAARKVRDFALALAEAVDDLGVGVRLFDERLSTVSAEAVLRAQGRKGKSRRAVVDQAAAVIILQNALDAERATGRVPGEAVSAAGEDRRSGRVVTDEREDVSPPRYDDLDADPDAGHHQHHPEHDPGHDSGHDSGHEHHSFFTRRHAEHHDHDPHGPRRRRGLASCLVIIVVLVIVGGVAVYAVAQGVDKVKDMFAGPEDYSGEGTGSVLFEVQEGDTTTAIGRKLEAEGVVASIEAFTDQAAEDATAARGIQVGFYELRKEMPAEAAFDVLVDPDNLVQASVTIPEGLRVEDTLERIAKDTDISLASLKKAAADGEAIGLPAYAQNNPEGYLFPATYAIPPNADATSVLSSMVDRWRQAAEEADLEGAAKELGYTPAELMTVASLVEAEANRDEDRGKVARVIYNRLETDATNGLLQIDATVNYALGRDLGLGLTQEDLQVDSPYNTRKNPGLPPGPIESPGDAAIEAATTPTDGDWVYYVTVDLDTGETKFTEDYQEFLKYKQELLAWCETSDRC